HSPLSERGIRLHNGVSASFPGEGGFVRLDHAYERCPSAYSRLRRHFLGGRCGESGQAMVEFALILIPLLIVVVGIIQFGIGLNYWLDMNRLSNQGARWAVVNGYPGCNDSINTGCGTSLQQYISCQRLPSALKPTVDISFPDGPNTYGNPVKVTVTSPY